MCEYDYEAMGNEIALRMMILKRVREPTLWQVQQDCEEKFKSTPAWLQHSQPHPGLPEHYLTLCSIVRDETSTVEDDEVPLPKLPFDVNREIFKKLLIVPATKKNQKRTKLPQLNSLANGCVLIVGPPLNEPFNTEVFLVLHDKLLPCCYSKRLDVIINSPTSSVMDRVRCYYIHDESLAQRGITFLSSNGKLLHYSELYLVKWAHGSTPYHMLNV